MSLEFIYGPASGGKTQYILRRLLKQAGQDWKKRYIFVVPEQYALSVERDLVELSEGKGILNIEVLSFSRLAYRIMEESADKMLPVMNDIGKTMLIKRIMQEKRGELSLYAGKEKNIGFLDEIKSVISEFTQYLIKPEMLSEAAEKNGNGMLGHKLKDLFVIYSEFLRQLSALGCVTSENMAELCFRHIGNSPLFNNSVLVFDGFTGFTPIQYEFIERLLMRGCDSVFGICGDENLFKYDGQKGLIVIDKDCELFEMSAEMAENIIELAVKNGNTISAPVFVDYPYNCDEIRKLKDGIFRNGTALKAINAVGAGKEDCPEKKAVKLVSLLNKKNEVLYAASEISELIRSGSHYKDVALVCGDLGSYAPFITEIFEEYDLPFYIDRNETIEGNPLVRLILNAFTMADSDLGPDAVTAFLKSPLFDYGTGVFAFENYIISRNYRGQNSYRRCWKARYKGNRSLDMDVINKIRRDVLSAYKLLKLNGGRAKVKKLTENIRTMLISLEAEEKLTKLSEGFSSSRLRDAGRLKREYERVYNAVLSLLDQIDLLIGEEDCSYRELRDIFLAGISKISLGMIPRQNDVVIAGDLKRTRLGGIRHLFFLGVNEGVVPQGGDDGGIFTKDDRLLLNSEGVKLAEPKSEKPAREEYYVYLTLAKPSDSLCVTWSEYSEKSQGSDGELKASYVVGAIADCLGIKTSKYRLGGKISELSGLCSVTDEEKVSEIRNSVEGSINGVLTAGEVKELYGENPVVSVTGIQKFNACPFAFFAGSGLDLAERPVSEPMAFDYGNLMHTAIQYYISDMIKLGINWKEADAGEYKTNALQALEKSVQEYVGKSRYQLSEEAKEESGKSENAGFLEAFDTEEAGSKNNAGDVQEDESELYDEPMYLGSKRLENLVKRMGNVMLVLTDAIHTQLRAGSYKPELIEKKFRIRDDENEIEIHGTIDRVDVARDDKNSKNYVKVVDYKTGSTVIDLTELYYGIQIQLPLYLDKVIAGLYPDAVTSAACYQPVKDVKPAGAETIQDALEARKKRRRALLPEGLYNTDIQAVKMLDNEMVDEGMQLKDSYKSDAGAIETDKNCIIKESASNITGDGEFIREIASYADRKLKSSAAEIKKGRIDINPYKYSKGSETELACDNCSFRSFCGIDLKQNKYRKCFNVLKTKDKEDFGGKSENE